jgi:hypothetical protein
MPEDIQYKGTERGERKSGGERISGVPGAKGERRGWSQR